MLYAVTETYTVPDDGDVLVDVFRVVRGIRSTKAAAVALATKLAYDSQESEYPDGGVDSFHAGTPATDDNLTAVVVYEDKREGGKLQGRAVGYYVSAVEDVETS